MTGHVPNAHTPGEMRALSNVAHVVEDSVISGAGALMIADAFRGGVYRRAAGATLLLGSGIQLLGYREPEGAYESGHQDSAY